MSHRFRKIATVLLATAVTLQSTTFAAITREPEFSDLSEHWSKSIMMRLNGYGVICGYDDGTIRPDSYVSVTEFLTMMVKSLGFETEPGDGYWATPYIQKAVELGLIEPDEYSDYDATLTRSQAAKIIANALSDTAIADENAVKAKIYDYAEIAEEYKPYVLIAYDKKIVNGNHDNCFEPNRNITRAEASVIAVRLIDKNGGIKKPDNGNGPNNNSGDVTSSAKLYVAPNGSDNNDGSESSPFATVQKAKETIRNMNAANSLPEGGVTVYLRGGTYYIDEGMTFTKEDSGKEGSTITYTSYPGEAVTISGQVPLEKGWFTAADDTAKNVMIDKNAASKVLMVDLKEHGITDYGELSTRGYHYFNKGRYAQAELIVNDENQTLAR